MDTPHGDARQTVHPGVRGLRVALLDYDNDGWLDIYLVNGADADQMNGKGAMPHAALFHNNHDGTFTTLRIRPVSAMTAGVLAR